MLTSLYLGVEDRSRDNVLGVNILQVFI